MVIDINLLRKDRGGDPEIVLQSERDRFRSTDRVNNILVLDEKWRELRHKLDTLNKNKNLCSKFFGIKAKEKGGNSNPNTTNPCNINISNNTTQTSNTTANLTGTPTASNLANLNPINFNPIISNPINENNRVVNPIINNNSNINPVNTNNNKNNIIVNPIINNNSNTNLIKNNNSNINPITDDINNNRHDNPIINNNSNINQINNNNSNIKLITDNNNNNNLTNPNNNTINNNKINDNNNLININNINIDLLNITNDLLDKLNINELKTLSKTIDAHVINLTKVLKTTEDERDCLLREVGNLLHRTVPISSDEDNNAAVRFCGDHTKIAEHSHVDLLLMIDGADYKRGVAVAGNRGYFLKGPAVFLAHALVDYSLKLLYDKDFVPLYTPFFMKKNLMSAVAQLSQFDDELYKVVSKSENKYDDSTTSDDKYLIATSEQTIASFHKDEWLSPDSLPLKYAGISTCFRQEVGSHGRDTTGIFRVHQFEKVEQFVICSPLNDESWRHLDLMIQNAEELCKNLGFGYRIVSIVSGALNNAAAKKLDLEAWFPGSKAFRELVSCSNCTDYQSRSLGIRFGCTKQLNKEVKFVHMLNCTMCAVTRYLCCLLETHQTDKGINVPACLHPYIPENLKFIPFVRTVEEVRKLQ